MIVRIWLSNRLLVSFPSRFRGKQFLRIVIIYTHVFRAGASRGFAVEGGTGWLPLWAWQKRHCMEVNALVIAVWTASYSCHKWLEGAFSPSRFTPTATTQSTLKIHDVVRRRRGDKGNFSFSIGKRISGSLTCTKEGGWTRRAVK